MLSYAGIGARKTPLIIVNYIQQLGRFFALKNITLRSGHAKRADQAFETGCDSVKGNKEIYLPWKGFEGSASPLIVTDRKAFDLAKQFHDKYESLSHGARRLQARNSHQILGQRLDEDSKSDFLICWTERGEVIGGTGQALRMAGYYTIPIFNLGNYKDIEEIKVELKKFLIENIILKEEDFVKKMI